VPLCGAAQVKTGKTRRSMQMIVRVPRRRFGFVQPVESQIKRSRDSRCAVAANHEPTNSHKFPIEFLLTPAGKD